MAGSNMFGDEDEKLKYFPEHIALNSQVYVSYLGPYDP
jgi:hypothetical protein